MVIAALRSLLSPPPPKREAQSMYIALVAQSRKAFFHTDCAVPDTLDGRFDIIVLHVFLAIKNIDKDASSNSEELTRLLLESLFDDMDRSLREMGVGDMGVGKRIKKMAKSVFGRLEAYKESFGDDARLREALLRNVYRGEDVAPEAVEKLLQYVKSFNSTGGFL